MEKRGKGERENKKMGQEGKREKGLKKLLSCERSAFSLF
jgi:hypothetical protein